jgi:hypothetical protein
LNFYQSLLDELRNQNNNTNNFLVCFFDGNKCTYPFDSYNKKDFLTIGEHKWIKTDSNRTDSVENDILKLAQENLLDFDQTRCSQKSNFETLTVKERSYLDEPSVIAINIKTEEVVAFGEKASDMVGRTPPYIVTFRPLKNGVIANFHLAAMMIRGMISKANL